MIGTEAQDQFIGRSVIVLLATVRAAGTPSTSMISFALSWRRTVLLDQPGSMEGPLAGARSAMCPHRLEPARAVVVRDGRGRW